MDYEKKLNQLSVYMHYYITEIALEIECKRTFYPILSFNDFITKKSNQTLKLFIDEWKFKYPENK